jgi:hypothetical protein
MPTRPDEQKTYWNSSELRAGIDRWPVAQATVTNIDQLYNQKHSFLSVITFTYKDKADEYYAGKFHMRTADLPDDLMTGSAIAIRYDPKDPDKSWSEYDYYRAGFGRFQTFDYPIAFVSLVLFIVLLIGAMKLFHVGTH